MRISGFTIARQAIALGYPLEESIRSLLPLVDEMIVGVGDGDDGTWELVQSIGDAKIAAFRSTWDATRRHGGEVLSQETNKALARCRGDWGIYLQADEVLHEDELPALRAALVRHDARRTEALSFRYFHFYGSYQTLQDNPDEFYPRATRAVRLGVGVQSVGDACAFLVRDDRVWRKPRRADLGLHVYHYGWARPPAVMLRKQRQFAALFHDDAWIEANGIDAAVPREIYARGNLRYFRGSHPAVMRARVARQDWDFDPHIDEQAPAWLRHARNYLRWYAGRARRQLRRVTPSRDPG